MVLLREIKKRARFITGPVLAIAVFGYFAYHSIQGDRGLIAWVHLSQQIEIADANFEKVARERLALERRTNLLRPDHLDPDMLDERVRQNLGLILPNEIIIMDKAAAGPTSSDVEMPPVSVDPLRPADAPARAPAPAGLAAHAANAAPAATSGAAKLADLANKITVSFAPAR
ncbi:MAG TPA: septum formation initiator family protein [Alphaproteobacteria bacterium]|jgi:cell division protein FtsB